MPPVHGISVLSLAYNPLSEIIEKRNQLPASQLPQLTGLSLASGPKIKTKATEVVSQSRYVARKGFGQEGELLPVFANHFPLEIVDRVVYHYDLDIELTRAGTTNPSPYDQSARFSKPDFNCKKLRKLNYQVNREVITTLIANNSSTADQVFFGITPVYDGLKNMYTKKRLPNVQKRLFVTVVEADGMEAKTYAVEFKFVGEIDLEAVNLYYRKLIPKIPEDCVQVLDIILRHGPNSLRIPVGQSLYVDRSVAQRLPLGYGREVAFGFYQSVRNCMNGPNLVVDRSATAFYVEGPLLHFVAQILAGNSSNNNRNFDERRLLSVPQLRDSDRKRVERELKTLQIQVTHLPYKKKMRVAGLSYVAAREITFKTSGRNGETPRTISVPEHFRNEYGIHLQFANLPCVIVGTGATRKFLPIEVCELVKNQVVRRKLSTDQLAQLIRTTTSQTPSQRFGIISDSVQAVLQDSKPYLKEFGITIRSQPMIVDSRVLEPPQVSYSGLDTPVKPLNGAWFLEKNHNLWKVKEHLNSDWVLVNFAQFCLDQEADKFIEALCLKGEEMGVKIGKPCKVARVQNYKPGMVENIFEKAKACCPKLKMVVFIITGDDSLYNEIKLMGDIQEGVPTQCLLEKNAKRPTAACLANIIFKINTKLGGVNNVLATNAAKPAILRKRVMIIGADVTHPSNDKSTISSVAAIVGSFDSECTKYFASVRVQERNKQEVIRNLDEMTAELLEKYKKENNGLLPQHIVIYRDGVSEGQFDEVLNEELLKISAACAGASPGYKPKLSLIVVQKRHHTRFIPCEERMGVGKYRNIPPGTVIDTDIVHPTDFDFYLCSHFGVQGTSRPTHYHVLWDDNNFGPDELQKLTFYLTHVYAKCARSISIPAPVQYAHLAAYRARVHIVGVYGSETASLRGSSDNRRTSRESNEERREREELIHSYNETTRVADNMRKAMYFC